MKEGNPIQNRTEQIVPGAGDYHFLLERVTSLGEL